MAKSWKEVTSEEELEQIAVTLRTRMGIAPRVYVPLVWTFLLLLILFLTLLLPGIRSYGTVLLVESSPSGAEVLIDGSRRGTTPLETFVEAGSRDVEVRLPGFPPWEESVDFAGRRFAGALLPLHDRRSVVFTESDTGEIRENTVRDFAAWALGPEPGPQFQHPPVARWGGRRIWARTLEGSERSDRIDRTGHMLFARDLLAHAQPHQAADLLGGVLRTANPGAALTAGSIAETVQTFVQLDNNYPGFHRVLADLADHDAVRILPWYRVREDSLSTDLLAASVSLDEGRSPPIRLRTLAGLEFAAVPPGRYAIGYPLRNGDTTGVLEEYQGEFWIQATETTREAFARFILAEPAWQPQRVRAQGLYDYLRDWPEDFLVLLDPSREEGQFPVRYVHQEAATAFARWVQEEARPGEGERIRLPRSGEWEYAAFLNDSSDPPLSREQLQPVWSAPRGALGIPAMAGGLWEWTTDWYGRAGHILDPEYGATVTVMGGSFANAAPAHTLRGGQDPRTTSPFLGFRLVIAPATDGE